MVFSLWVISFASNAVARIDAGWGGNSWGNGVDGFMMGEGIDGWGGRLVEGLVGLVKIE